MRQAGQTDRRAFLQTAGGAGLLAGGLSGATGKQPTVTLGDVSVSRLIAGGNTMRGFSHSSKKLSLHMLEYFTAPQITEFLVRCGREGINTFQSSYSETVRDGLLGAREKGSSMQFICLNSAKGTPTEEVMKLEPIAIVHHGGVTDSMYRAGKQEAIHDYLKQVHDAGVMAGVSSHDPDNIARCEDAGWETDLYMTCFHNLSRTREELRRMLGADVLGEVFLGSDPAAMAKRIREVSKPCLAFKILAAGRKAEKRETLTKAFAFAFENIKPLDAVIVGMYPKFSDEIGEDAELSRRFGMPS